jgi:alpha-galactosidase
MHRTLIPILLFSLVVTPAALPGEPIKVFVLAGQSNMEGAGAIAANPKSHSKGKGSLENLVQDPATAKRFAHLVDGNGEWVERGDVWVYFGERKGRLKPGFGARKTTIGPELGFGTQVGDAIEAPVVLVKTAWGGKSLVKDFRPPSSGGETGAFFEMMLTQVDDALAELKTDLPEHADRGYEIAGFASHQGWNDGLKQPWVAEYGDNLANLIDDVRKAWKKPALPVVIGVSGFGGRGQKIDRRLGIIAAQLGVAEREKFMGTVTSVETRDFWRTREESPSGQGYHWNSNAESYYLIGEAMGKAMVELVQR